MTTLISIVIFLAVLSGFGLMCRLAAGRASANFLCSALVGVVGGLLVGWLGGSPEIGISFPLGFCLVIISTLSVPFYSTLHKKHMQGLVAQAEGLRKYCTEHFDVLDVDGDGMITHYDLIEVQDRKLPGIDLAIVKMLERDRSLIGHIIHTHISVMPATGQTAFINLFGISREDLAVWPDRVRKFYSHEFGDEKPEAQDGKK